MSADILTRWALVRETAVSAGDIGPRGRLSDDAVLRWFADGRSAYFDRCANLRKELRSGRIRIQTAAVRVGPPPAFQQDSSALVAVSVIELRPTSFDMALRVRGLDADDSAVVDGRCTVMLADAATGASLEIPEVVRREVIALEQGATDYC